MQHVNIMPQMYLVRGGISSSSAPLGNLIENRVERCSPSGSQWTGGMLTLKPCEAGDQIS